MATFLGFVPRTHTISVIHAQKSALLQYTVGFMPYKGLGQIRNRLLIHYIGILRSCQELFGAIRSRNFKKIQVLGIDKPKFLIKLRGWRRKMRDMGHHDTHTT